METGVETLSARQREILRLIAQNLQAKEVARLLGISEKTVRTHTEEARRRLSVGTIRDAARLLVAAELEAGGTEAPAPALRHDDRPSPRPMPDAPPPPLASGHEYELSSRRKLSDHQLGRAGYGPGLAGDARETGVSGGHPAVAQEAERYAGAETDHPFGGRGDSLADDGYGGRWRALKRWLRSRSAWQWYGLILLSCLVSVLIFAATMSAIIGGLQSINTIARLAR
jgi:DNA-binding CsgD family transcriptional regulator